MTEHRVDGRIIEAILHAEAVTFDRGDDLEVFLHPVTASDFTQCFGHPIVRSSAVQPDTARVFDRRRLEWVA